MGPKEMSKSQELHLFNTLTKTKLSLNDHMKNKTNKRLINWYICGPTVYDSPHLGHARTYICSDVIRRVLEYYFGYDINYVMNMTDVDDKIIKKALGMKELEGKSRMEKVKYVAQKYEKEFLDAMDMLNV